MSTWTIYFILTLDSLLVFLILTGVVSVVVGCIAMGVRNDEYDRDKKRKILRHVIIPAFTIASIFFFVSIVTPSTRQALVIMGSDYVNHNERIEKNVDKTLEYIERVLDEKLSDTKEDK